MLFVTAHASGQRQWWAIYVEMSGADALPAAATAVPNPETAATSDENENTNDTRLPTTDKTKLDSAQDTFNSFIRPQQQQQQLQQLQEQESIV